MTDVFEEVDQSLRQDTAAKVWKRTYPWIIGVFLLVLAGVGIWEFGKYQRAQGIEAQAKLYDTATAALRKDPPDLAAARQTFVQIAEGKDGYAVAANHMVAQLETQMANDPAAIELALSAAALKDKDGLLGTLATLKLAYAKADKSKLEEVEALLKPVIAKGGHPAALARELVAAKALEAGDVERARSEYQSLSLEIDAPDSLKQRAERALQALPAVTAATPAAATPAPAAPATPAPAAPAKPPTQ